MEETKVIARFAIPGAVMYPKEVCAENPGKFEHKITVKVEEVVKEGGVSGSRVKYMHVPIRNSIPAERVMSISMDVYKEWMQKPPTKDDQKMWSVWDRERKIKRHLEEMAKTFGESLVSFSILSN